MSIRIFTNFRKEVVDSLSDKNYLPQFTILAGALKFTNTVVQHSQGSIQAKAFFGTMCLGTSGLVLTAMWAKANKLALEALPNREPTPTIASNLELNSNTPLNTNNESTNNKYFLLLKRRILLASFPLSMTLCLIG